MWYFFAFLLGLAIGTYVRYEGLPEKLMFYIQLARHNKRLRLLRRRTREGDMTALTKRVVFTTERTEPTRREMVEIRIDNIKKFLKRLLNL